jgi:phosphatidylserine decarboxylase
MQRRFIAKEGFPYIGSLAGLLVLFLLLGCTALAAATLVATVLVTNFFRDPERRVPHVSDAVLAPADGRIVFVGPVFEDRFLHQESLKISIFMTIFDVHVNRIPLSGEVVGVHYSRGKFFSANLDKASRDNEHNAVVLQVPEGEKFLFVQIAGFIARRIGCWIQPGDRVHRGERFGIIRFGSRLDFFAPVGTSPAVSKGQRVKAGESILCYYPNRVNIDGVEDRAR